MRRVGEDDAANWDASYWISPWDEEIHVYIKRRATHDLPAMKATGSAPRLIRYPGWLGWSFYRAAARALRALG